MAAKFVVFCVFAVLGQSFAGSSYRKSISAPNCGCGSNRVSISVTEDDSIPVYSYEGIGVSEDYQPSYKPISSSPVFLSDNGGTFTVTSIGAIAPAGIAVATDLGLAGELAVSGELPYLSAVAFEGQFDTSGSAPVSYGCGDCVAITQEIGNPNGNAAVSSGLSAGNINSCGCARRS